MRPDTCPEMPHVGVLAAWAGLFLSPRFPPLFRSDIGAFFFLKRKDLQFPATRVRIRHGGDFPGIKITPQQAEALPTPPPCAKVIVAPLHNCKQHCDKHSIAYLSHRNKYAFQRVQGSMDSFGYPSLCMRFSISGDSRPLALKSAEGSGVHEHFHGQKHISWGGEHQKVGSRLCRVHRIG